MTSTLGGNDPLHDLDPVEIDKMEKKLREEAEELLRRKKVRERKRKLDRAREVSREKSKRAHKGSD